MQRDLPKNGEGKSDKRSISTEIEGINSLPPEEVPNQDGYLQSLMSSLHITMTDLSVDPPTTMENQNAIQVEIKIRCLNKQTN